MPLSMSFKDAKLIMCHDIPLTWKYIINAFFAAVPHHPVLQAATNLCYNATLNTEDIHLKTGPIVLGTAVANTISDDKYYLLPTNYFYRNQGVDKRFGTHTFAKMW